MAEIAAVRWWRQTCRHEARKPPRDQKAINSGAGCKQWALWWSISVRLYISSDVLTPQSIRCHLFGPKTLAKMGKNRVCSMCSFGLSTSVFHRGKTSSSSVVKETETQVHHCPDVIEKEETVTCNMSAFCIKRRTGYKGHGLSPVHPCLIKWPDCFQVLGIMSSEMLLWRLWL